MGPDRPAPSERGPLCMSLHLFTCLAMPHPREFQSSAPAGAPDHMMVQSFGKPVTHMRVCLVWA